MSTVLSCGQWVDAGFKISRAVGCLSPAREDVIILRTEIIMSAIWGILASCHKESGPLK